MSSLPTATTFGEEPEKYNQTSVHSRKARRRRYVIVLASAFLVFVYLLSPYNTTIDNPFAGFFSKVKTWTGCNSSNTMASSAHSAAGWHARSTEHTGSFTPVKADVLLNVLVNSQVEPAGFTMSLVKPNIAVDARGKVLTLSADDFAAFEAKIKEVKALPHTSGFKGQWRVKHDRTSFPIDIVQIPGEAERSVYGWSATTTTLEETTKGHASLPEPLQTLIGWAKEARTGYHRGQGDQTVIEKVKALVE